MNNPVSRKSNIVVQDLENELLIYDLKIDKALCLNQTSALVWQLCNGNNSMADISNLMSRKLKTAVSQDFVWLALDGLRKEKLLENETDLENHPAGLSRREVVKKVGLASMVALPIISSLVAPSATMAQSGPLPLLTVCTVDSECESGNCAVSNIGPLCCVDNDGGGSFPSFVPGIFIGNCEPDPTDCSSLSPVLGPNLGCCSGMATFQPGAGCGNGAGICVCS